MAFEAKDIEIDPALQDLGYPTPDSEDMRSEYNMADRLTIDVECPPLGTSTCSSFSPMDSPTPTPTSLYSQGSLASPGWPDGSAYSHGLEGTRTATPLRSSFRMADITAGDGMMHQYDNVDGHERVPLFDYMPGYTDNVEQFWIPQDIPKAYEPANNFQCQPNMGPQYPQMVRNCYRNNQPSYLPESASNPCLSRPIFQQTEQRLPNAMSMTNLSQWMQPTDMMQPQTITPAQAFTQAPMTPPSSYAGFPGSANTLRTHTPVTPVRSSSLGSGTETPMTRLSGGHSDNTDEEWISPGMRESLRHRPSQRQLSRKSLKKSSSRQNVRLENLPSIIRQVQFKCTEPGCTGRFKRQEHLKRHMKSHSKEKPHVCWVPGCGRGFSRSDNLNAHYTKTHSKRGGRNRYVATLDETSPDFDPDFRGQLTPDGRPIYGSKLDDPIPMDSTDADGDSWDE